MKNDFDGIVINKGSIVSVDIETTGINKNTDEILQVAIVNGNGEIIFYSYIKPEKNYYWPNAERINHISPSMVKDAPFFYEVASEIYSALNNAKLIVGYNIDRFDMPFLEKSIGKRINTNTYDVMMYFSNNVIKEKKCYGGFKFQKLSSCCSYYGVVNENAHDSLGDAQVTLKCFYKMIEQENIKIVFN